MVWPCLTMFKLSWFFMAFFSWGFSAIHMSEQNETVPLTKAMQAFVDELHRRLDSAGLRDLPEAELESLKEFVYSYEFEERDWKDMVFFRDKGYTRNLVDSGNGFFDLLLLGWRPKQFRYHGSKTMHI